LTINTLPPINLILRTNGLVPTKIDKTVSTPIFRTHSLPDLRQLLIQPNEIRSLLLFQFQHRFQNVDQVLRVETVLHFFEEFF
jgi:hypothetical protein